MNNDYISRADVVAVFEKVEDLYDPEWGNKRYTPDDVEEIINDVPAADVRPVVLCRDCKHRPFKDSFDRIQGPRVEGTIYEDFTCPFLCDDDYYNRIPMDSHFCAFGERKEADHIADPGKKVDPCSDCRWSPPSSGDGKPCCACDPDDPLLNCYQRKEDTP